MASFSPLCKKSFSSANDFILCASKDFQDGFRPDALDLGHLVQAVGEFGQQLVQDLERADDDQVLHLLGQDLADAVDAGQVLAGQQHVLDGDRVVADALGDLGIGVDLELVLIFQGKEEGHLVENAGDLLVGHGRSPACMRRSGKNFIKSS